MELTHIGEMSFEDNPDLPEIIYKYRIWDDKYQKTILTDRIVFMAPPTSFKDKKDCKLLKRYDLMTEQDMYDKYLEMSKKDNPNWSRQKHRAFARDWTKKSPLRDKKNIKKLQEEHFLEFDQRFGVFSLTANPINLDMWNKYSKNGEGFCVGFDPKILFNHLGGGGPVQYYEKLPDIFYNDDFHVEHFKQVFSKEEKWLFEEEYRTHKFYPKPTTISDRQIVVPVEVFKEVIFGWYMSDQHIEQIKQACEMQMMKIEFKCCSVENEDIKIKTCC